MKIAANTSPDIAKVIAELSDQIGKLTSDSIIYKVTIEQLIAQIDALQDEVTGEPVVVEKIDTKK